MFLATSTKRIVSLLAILIFVAVVICSGVAMGGEDAVPTSDSYIKWVKFDVPYSALNKALNYDITTHSEEIKVSWIEILAYLAAKYYGSFSRYKSSDMDKFVTRLRDGAKIEELTKDMKYYNFYYESYTAVLGGFVGSYRIQQKDKDGNIVWVEKYGLQVFSPIAKGYGYSHYDDYGDSRTYGYRRTHLGNDLIGSIGTPVIAVESGVIEVLGWNMYGGWRIGIRSLDGKRSYYYAHLRKNRPYAEGLKVGQTVQAGDVIGYLGMTGYSLKENINNMTTPHLHFGMQLIFDESQKEGVNQIWIDVYNIVNLLQNNRSAVTKNSETKEYTRTYQIQLVGGKQ